MPSYVQAFETRPYGGATAQLAIADTLCAMPAQDPRVLAAAGEVVAATHTPTVIDADDLVEARLDERWRDFCLNAEQYVADTTRPKPSLQQSS